MVIYSVMIRYREFELKSDKIKRVFMSGSSSSGKTTLCKMMIMNKFFGEISRIYYFHPDFHETNPIADWEEKIKTPILVNGGLPSFQDLINLSSNCLVILDDLIQEICESKDIDYLFRVLSSKRQINVVIMSQRYFIGQKFGLSIRNSSNYHILLRNADERTNSRVASLFNLKTEINMAQNINSKSLYPYILLDRTPEARVNNCQVYIDILGKYKRVVIGSMIFYLVSEQDFSSIFDRIDKTHAILKNGITNKTQELQSSAKHKCENGKSENCELGNYNVEESRDRESRQQSKRNSRQSTFGKRQHLARTVRRLVSQYRIRGQL